MKYVVFYIFMGQYCNSVCACVSVYWRGSVHLLVHSRVTPGTPGGPDIVVLLWPSVVSDLHDVIRSPWYGEVRMPTKRTQRLHVCWGALFGNRRGSGEGRKKRISPGFQKKQRFIEVNCRLNIPWSTIGEERETKLPSKLTYVKLKFF